MTIQEQHSQLVKALVKSPEDLAAEMTASKANLNHALIGIAGELFELVLAYHKPHDVDNLIEEVGDVLFYAEQIRQELNFSWSEIDHNLPKEFAALVGLGHAGDMIIDAVKKFTIYNADSVNMENLLNGISLLITYLKDILYQHTDFGLDHCRAANIKKLSKRYSGGFSNEAAKIRADKNPE